MAESAIFLDKHRKRLYKYKSILLPKERTVKKQSPRAATRKLKRLRLLPIKRLLLKKLLRRKTVQLPKKERLK